MQIDFGFCYVMLGVFHFGCCWICYGLTGFAMEKVMIE